ncbi:ABC transporter substrate-binding protein [Paenibacillus sp. SI8]|uniref:ABC transporter substrate-binding protein n=1 Tax=unclassified Paenibacillus TaxID=185978 RepID=UPI003465312B
MRFFKRSYRSTLFSVFIALVLLLSACASSISTPPATPTAAASPPAAEAAKGQSGNAQAEKILYVATVNPPASVNQINTQSDGASAVVYSLYNDSLMDVNDKLEFLPKIAQSVETKDNQTYTVKLNPAAKWNDGQPFTAADVEFTLRTALHAKVDTNFTFNFIEGLNAAGKLDEGKTDISGLNIIDDKTFEIRTKTPVDPLVFKERFATKIYFLPKHILKDIPPEQINTNPYFQNPEVTIGAFKLSKFVKGSYTELSKNTNYYLGVPKLDKIFVKVLPATNLVAQLQTGEIHMNSLPFGLIPITDYEKVKGLPNIDVTTSEPTEPVELFFNTEKIPEKARQAIAYALNRKLIVEQLLKGQGEVVDGALPPTHPYANTKIESYTYDPEKAKKLLQEAKWDFSKPLVFLIPVGNKIREQAADILAQNLEAVGLKIEVQKYDFPTLIQKVRKVEFDLTIFNRGFYVEPSSYFTFFKSDGPNNWFKYKNPLADDLILKGETEVIPNKRKEIYNQLQEVLHNDLPALGIYSERRLQAVNKQVIGGKPLRIGMFNNVQEWDIQQ